MIELTVVTPEGEKFSGQVETVVLPGSEGDFGVLEHHERFLTPLRIGELEVKTASGETLVAAIAGGFADVSGEKAVVLVESCELSDEIDSARAELARSRAEQELAQLGASEDAVRQELFEAALKRAVTRLSVSQKSGD